MKTYLYSLPTFVAIILAVFILANKTFAFDVTSLPTCLAPVGDVLAQFDSGVHGIVGDTSVHTGSDTVYQTGDGTYLQCYCDENGNGIQTNWIMASTLSEEDQAYLRSQGWIEVP